MARNERFAALQREKMSAIVASLGTSEERYEITIFVKNRKV